MFFWNRRLAYSTFSLDGLASTTALLSRYGIRFETKTVQRGSPSVWSDSRARTGTFGQDMARAYEYFVYVNAKDAEYADYLLRNQGIV